MQYLEALQSIKYGAEQFQTFYHWTIFKCHEVHRLFVLQIRKLVYIQCMQPILYHTVGLVVIYFLLAQRSFAIIQVIIP